MCGAWGKSRISRKGQKEDILVSNGVPKYINIIAAGKFKKVGQMVKFKIRTL